MSSSSLKSCVIAMLIANPSRSTLTVVLVPLPLIMQLFLGLIFVFSFNQAVEGNKWRLATSTCSAFMLVLYVHCHHHDASAVVDRRMSNEAPRDSTRSTQLLAPPNKNNGNQPYQPTFSTQHSTPHDIHSIQCNGGVYNSQSVS